MSSRSARVGFWLIVAACIVSILLAATACTRVEEKDLRPPYPSQPEPSNEVQRYKFRVAASDARVDVIEFRDSAGRLCVLAYGSNGRLALSCAVPLPPLDYECLPEVQPRRRTGI